MTVDPAKIQYFTGFDTFKNYITSDTSINIPSQSYSAGQTRPFSTIIEFIGENSTYEILQNYSHDSSKYYIGSWVVLFAGDAPDSNFQIVTQASIISSTMTFTSYVTNIDVSSHTLPAFTINLEVRRFITPF